MAIADQIPNCAASDAGRADQGKDEQGDGIEDEQVPSETDISSSVAPITGPTRRWAAAADCRARRDQVRRAATDVQHSAEA